MYPVYGFASLVICKFCWLITREQVLLGIVMNVMKKPNSIIRAITFYLKYLKRKIRRLLKYKRPLHISESVKL